MHETVLSALGSKVAMSGLLGEELIYVLGLLAHGEGVVQLSSSVSSLARSLSLPPTVWLFLAWSTGYFPPFG